MNDVITIDNKALVAFHYNSFQWNKRSRKGYSMKVGIFTKFVILVIKETKDILYESRSVKIVRKYMRYIPL